MKKKSFLRNELHDSEFRYRRLFESLKVGILYPMLKPVIASQSDEFVISNSQVRDFFRKCH